MPNYMNRYSDPEKARLKRYEERRDYYAKTAFIYKGKRPWTPEEDSMVLTHSITDHELSALITRSVNAIQGRRWKLKNAFICKD